MRASVITVWMSYTRRSHHLYDFVQVGHISRTVYSFLQDRDPDLKIKNRMEMSGGQRWDLIEVTAELSESDQTYLSMAIGDKYTPLLV